MLELPEHVDWPLLVAHAAHRYGCVDISEKLGIERSSVIYYLDGDRTRPKFDTGVKILRHVEHLSRFDLQHAIGMPVLPLLPDHSIDWTVVVASIRSTYGPREMRASMSESQYECYTRATRKYKSKPGRKTRIERPSWTSGAMLLNLAQCRLKTSHYKAMIIRQSQSEENAA